MNLFDCSGCGQRYIAAEADEGSGGCCPNCGAELLLVVRRLPGSAKAIAAALDALILDELSTG